MFEGFDSRDITTSETVIRVRSAGNGPAVLLLHGYPQTHACWHAVAPVLAERFTVVVADLRGYGDSAKPVTTPDHSAYSKRQMGIDMVEMMAELGHHRFAVAGHDRGARVAYRMAFDHPGKVSRVAVLDIVPTHATWEAMRWKGAIGSYHWQFLAQPNGLPERLIGNEPEFYLRETLRRWAAPGFEFDDAAMAEYIRCFSDPATIHAACEDYRAGASIDHAIDAEDYGNRKIQQPLLSLWGDRGGARNDDSFLHTWREWAADVRGGPIPGGHFLPEEAPVDTARMLYQFFLENE